MQIQSLLLSVLLAATAVRAAVNEPCYGAGGAPGVCISTSTCSSAGGTSIVGACPRDADNIRCCTKPNCPAAPDNCRWTSDCAGSSVSNLCPGPADFQCCQSSANGYGGYARPSIPPVGACRQVAVNGARRIVDAFPGRVRQVFCIRDCACGSGSDHCCGKATDMMCSDRGGQATTSGREIAEWVMNNRAALNLKYVIWGQRIWSPSDGVRPWTSWDDMEDRGDITQNHWQVINLLVGDG
ncbi:hypothetical protein H2201_008492 [Coniosporium apollinis]|uniref:ARB-07466-like C-terminal domain-containing protein n=1 Tax=Coniosporium apollinis TaxID=61459 RepID=A0ABQ9NG27_9PEZI|nr:hypothetical protein H2201_008492 [Coniosporium apollinis]